MEAIAAPAAGAAGESVAANGGLPTPEPRGEGDAQIALPASLPGGEKPS